MRHSLFPNFTPSHLQMQAVWGVTHNINRLIFFLSPYSLLIFLSYLYDHNIHSKQTKGTAKNRRAKTARRCFNPRAQGHRPVISMGKWPSISEHSDRVQAGTTLRRAADRGVRRTLQKRVRGADQSSFAICLNTSGNIARRFF